MNWPYMCFSATFCPFDGLKDFTTIIICKYWSTLFNNPRHLINTQKLAGTSFENRL